MLGVLAPGRLHSADRVTELWQIQGPAQLLSLKSHAQFLGFLEINSRFMAMFGE
jgi:hypothetical protein